MDLAINLSKSVVGTNSFNDLLILNGDLALVDGQPAIAQAISQALRFFRGEWFLDVTQGLPYLPELFTQPVISAAFEAEIQAAILSVPGVDSLIAWSMAKDNKKRAVNISFRAATVQGEVVWAQSVSL